MINLFLIPPTDASIHFLAQIFGPVGTILPQEKAPLLLGVMFRYFNSIVLVVAVLVIIYVTIIGILKTAHEGEFLGKQWNSIWIPIRMVLGIAALVPSSSGYCAIQIIMMWIVVQGIGAADTIWTTVLKYTSVFGSPTASPTVPSVDTTNNIQTLYQSLVCQANAHATYSYRPPSEPSDSTRGTYYCYDPSTKSTKSESFCQKDSTAILNITSAENTEINGTNKVYNMGPSKDCGSLTFCDPEQACKDTSTPDKSMTCSVCQGQQQVLQNTVNVLASIADYFVSGDYEYRTFYTNPNRDSSSTPSWVQSYCTANNIGQEQCCRAGNVTLPGFTTAAVSPCALQKNLGDGDFNNAAEDAVNQIYWPYYIKPKVGDADFVTTTSDNYVSAMTDVIVAAQTSNATLSDTTLKDAAAIGWIYAGAYYYYLAKQNDKTLNAQLPTLKATGNDPAADQNSTLYDYRNNYSAAGDLLDAMSSQYATEDSFDISVPSKLKSLKKISKGMSNSSTTVLMAFQSMMNAKDTNPIVSLQRFGAILLICAQALFALIFVVVVGMSMTGYFDVSVLGNWVANIIGPTLTTIVFMFAPLGSLLLGSLFTFGAMLAIYVPIIPYIVFTMGAVGWFILVIEAMVASPIIAIGILSPSGQHEIMGKAGDSLMYAFGLFLRPSLMIFGMMAAMLLSMVIVMMINAAFAGVMSSIYSKPGAGLVEILLFLCAYVGLLLVALNKCFALIHIIPDQTLRWIGGHGAAGAAGGAEGAGEALGSAKGAVGAGAGETQRAGAGAMGGAKAGSKGARAQAKAKQDKLKAQGETPDMTEGE